MQHMEVVQQNLFFFTLTSIPNEEVYCSRKFCNVLREGPEDLFFEDEAINASNVGEEDDENEIEEVVFSSGNRMEDIEFVRNQGLLVDDDNDPAPENIPQQQVSFATLFDDQSWGCNRIHGRASSVPFNQEPSFQGGWRPAKKSLLDVFKKMVPYKFYLDIVVELTSSALVAQKLPPMTEGEFL